MKSLLKKFKTPLIKIFCILLVFFICLHFINVSKRKLWGKLRFIKDNIFFIQQNITENNLLLKGYSINDFANQDSGLKSIFFMGHIYPQSGYTDKFNTLFLNPEKPLDHLLLIAKETPPLKMIFGGDNVQTPTDGSLNFLINLKSKLNMPQFILGNHELYWSNYQKPQFKKVFSNRYSYEDIDRVRLIYLHTEMKSGEIGLDKEQKEFLRKALDPKASYAYSLVFLHHAMWGRGVVTNAPYPNSSELSLEWEKNILPLFVTGRVVAVFSGDGGVSAPGSVKFIKEIPHYLSGWSFDRKDIPPEWLRIDLEDEGIQVNWQKLLNGQLFVKKQQTPLHRK